MERGLAVPRLVLSQLLVVLAAFYNVFDGGSGKRVLDRIYLMLFVAMIAIIVLLVIFTSGAATASVPDPTDPASLAERTLTNDRWLMNRGNREFRP